MRLPFGKPKPGHHRDPARSTALGCVSKLDPANGTLRAQYDTILDRFTNLALADYGTGRLLHPKGWVSTVNFLARFGKP